MNIKVGDHFLLPYTGSRKDRLIKVVAINVNSLWVVEDIKGRQSYCYVPTCTRVSPSVANRIRGEA